MNDNLLDHSFHKAELDRFRDACARGIMAIETAKPRNNPTQKVCVEWAKDRQERRKMLEGRRW